jgi:hypothetical protein
MDQYFTNHEDALKCWKILQNFLDSSNFEKSYHYIEPSSGLGSFFKLLPKNNSTGFELDKNICQQNPRYQCQDFLTVKSLKTKARTIIAIGNPPFTDGNGKNIGRKVSMQTLFINKCESLGCDVVAFIVGASMHRLRPRSPIKNMIIVQSLFMPGTSFTNNLNHSKVYNVYFDIYIRGKPEIFVSLDYIRGIDFGWELVLPDPNVRIDICFVRWGANVGQLVVPRQVRKEEYFKLVKYGMMHNGFTSSRYFFIQLRNPHLKLVWIEFLNNVKDYIFHVSTTTSSSLGMYELYFLWMNFAIRTPFAG